MLLWCRDLFSAGNGSLMGTIVITSGCATFAPWASAVGGIIGGLMYLPSSLFTLHMMKIDDPVDAFVVRITITMVLLLLLVLHAVPAKSKVQWCALRVPKGPVGLHAGTMINDAPGQVFPCLLHCMSSGGSPSSLLGAHTP